MCAPKKAEQGSQVIAGAAGAAVAKPINLLN